MDVPGIVNLKTAGDILISGAADERGIEYIRSEGVSDIIDLRRSEEIDPQYVAAVKSAGMNYHHIPMMSNAMTDEQAKQFLEAMEGIQNTRVLLQCASANRSGGMFGLYLGATGKCSTEEALAQAQAAGMRHPGLAQSIQTYLQKQDK